MAVNAPPPSRWNRKAFNKLRATWSQQRLDEDEKLLKRISDMAPYAPTLKEALDWADAHNVIFFIDRTAVNVNGYYSPGSGVVGITEKAARGDLGVVIGTLVHEIRHAWQDDNDLRRDYHADNFQDDLITNALIEADALAYGARAMDEYNVSLRQRSRTRLTLEQEKWLKHNKMEDLGFKFQGWFDNARKTQFYGHAASVRYANKLNNQKQTKPLANPGKTAAPPPAQPKVVRNYEYEVSLPVKKTLLFTGNIQDILPLGASFDGTTNYFIHLPPEVLPKLVVRPSLAWNFWGAARPEQKTLTAQIRKYDVRKKLAAPKKRHPWP